MKALLTATLLLFASACTPQEARAPAPDLRIARFEAQVVPDLVFVGEEPPPQSLRERMERHGVPGLSVAVMLDGEIAWARGYGLADVASGREVTSETLFQAASISKPVAAMAALRLVQQGALDLDDDVNSHLTAWSVPEHEWSESEAVTLRRLLSHTAGTTVHGFPGYARGSEIPTAVAVLDGAGNTDPVVVDIEPGSRFRYSGGGYTIVQQLLDDLSGKPFEELLAESVLDPLGMTRSSFGTPKEAPASGYRSDDTVVEGDWHVYPELAAAGLWTTPSDLARFALALQQGANAVLDAEHVEAMLTPVVDRQGLGPGVGGKEFGHGGANEGFRCLLTAALDGSWGVAVMTNSDSGSALAQEVLLTLAREYGWEGHGPREIELIALSTEELDAYVGDYRFEGYGTIAIAVADDRLVGTQPDGRRFELRPESRERFIDPADGLPATFEWADGQVVAMGLGRARGERSR